MVSYGKFLRNGFLFILANCTQAQVLPPLSPLYIFKLSLCPSKIRYFHNILFNIYKIISKLTSKTKLFKSAAHIVFRLLPSRLHILRIVIHKRCFNKYSNTEIRFKLQTLSFIYHDNSREMNVVVLVFIANRRPGIYRSLNARPSGLRFLVKCQTMRPRGLPGRGGGYGCPWN